MTQRSRPVRRQPAGTPEEIWAKRTDLQQLAMRYMSKPIGERDPCWVPYVKTMRSLIYLRLAKWGIRDDEVGNWSTRNATMTELGEQVYAAGMSAADARVAARNESMDLQPTAPKAQPCLPSNT